MKNLLKRLTGIARLERKVRKDVANTLYSEGTSCSQKREYMAAAKLYEEAGRIYQEIGNGMSPSKKDTILGEAQVSYVKALEEYRIQRGNSEKSGDTYGALNAEEGEIGRELDIRAIDEEKFEKYSAYKEPSKEALLKRLSAIPSEKEKFIDSSKGGILSVLFKNNPDATRRILEEYGNVMSAEMDKIKTTKLSLHRI